MKLSHKEIVALNRYKLSGIEGLRSESYTVACATISSLIRKGLFDKDGLTQAGRDIVSKFDVNTPIT